MRFNGKRLKCLSDCIDTWCFKHSLNKSILTEWKYTVISKVDEISLKISTYTYSKYNKMPVCFLSCHIHNLKLLECKAIPCSKQAQYLTKYLSIYLSIYLSMYLSIYLSISLSLIYLSLSLLYIYLYIYIYVCIICTCILYI